MNINSNSNRILFLFKNYLGKRGKVDGAIKILEELPELGDLLVAELNAAIGLFNRFQGGKLDIKTEYYVNSGHLANVIEIPLPRVETVFGNDRLYENTMKEVARFQFIDEFTDGIKLLNVLLVGYYRSYMLMKYPYLRNKNAQVASSLEEMLVYLALKGVRTNLFEATKDWIIDWKKEGFSKDLAAKIAYMKY